MRHASLFSGIGGPEIAAAMMGWDNVFHCEINPFGRQILDYWFPNSDSYEDITKTDFKRYRGTIDVLTGGFPCQPFSYTGKRKGQTDDRYLWPEMLRVIDETRPTWVIGENVAGITTMVEPSKTTYVGSEVTLFEKGGGLHRYTAEYTFTIERICSDLESKGYSVQPMLIPACAVGAPHRRDRIFFIAHYTDSCKDLRESGQHESEGGKEWVSKQNEVWKLRESDYVRSSSEIPASDSDGGAGWSEETECGGQEHLSSRQEGRSILCDSERSGASWDASDSNCERPQRRDNCNKEGYRQAEGGSVRFVCCDKMLPGNRWKGFPTISAVHRGNDGIPFDVDKLAIPFGKWRTESIKAYGNAIVPQVRYRIFQCIEQLNG